MKLKLASRSGLLRWLVIAACVPLAGLLTGAVIVGVREVRATAELRTKLNQLKQSGQPYDNASYEQWYLYHTHKEGAQAWLRILDTVSTTSQLGMVNGLPLVGDGKLLPELDSHVEWRDEPRVKEYLTEMQGVIQQIHQLKQWPAPVQLPVEFRGVGTLLPHYQQAMSLTRLLQLDFEYAVCHIELDRAMQDLRSIGTVAKGIDTSLCFVVDLMVSAALNSQYSEIQRSLLEDNWGTEQLSELRQMVSEVRITSAKWRALYVGERGIVSEDIVSGDLSKFTSAKEAAIVPLLNSGRLRIFDIYDEFIRIGDAEIHAWRRASKLAVNAVANRDATFDLDGTNVWIGLMFPAVEQMERAMEDEESNRRLTLTAIALRQFKRQEGSWPNDLGELAKVGLTAPSTNAVDSGDFNYETADGVAKVWGSESLMNLSDSGIRPSRDPGSKLNFLNRVTLR